MGFGGERSPIHYQEHWRSLAFFGEAYNALVPLLGERYLFWVKFGLLRRMRERSPQYLKVVGFKYDLKA
jgi:hypothetical protein